MLPNGTQLPNGHMYTSIDDIEGAWGPQTGGMHPATALTPPHDQEPSLISGMGPDGLTPLMLAVMRPFLSEAEEEANAHFMEDLLQRGADMNACTKTRGETALHLAARHNLPVAARKLLEHTTNPNPIDYSQETPLHAAVRADAIEVFRVSLLSLLASPF